MSKRCALHGSCTTVHPLRPHVADENICLVEIAYWESFQASFSPWVQVTSIVSICDMIRTCSCCVLTRRKRVNSSSGDLRRERRMHLGTQSPVFAYARALLCISRPQFIWCWPFKMRQSTTHVQPVNKVVPQGKKAFPGELV